MAEVKKIRVKRIRKSFRLFDFHFYDKKIDFSSTEEEDTDEPEEPQFIIQMFGVNEQGETCSLYINDYEPFFYIKIGDYWTEPVIESVLQDILKPVSKKHRPKYTEIVDSHKLYGFSAGKKHKFVKMVFTTMMSMNKVKNLWFKYDDEGERKRVPMEYRRVSIELYESNIPPLLRYFHIYNISPSGWVSFLMNHVMSAEPKTTTCNYEYVCSLKAITPEPTKETRVPYKICSFDIEASSSHGDFPLPKKTYKRLATQMTDIFIKQSSQLDEKKTKLLFKKVVMAAFGYGKFEDIDLVYPKKPVSIETIDSFVSTVIAHPIKNIINDEDDNKKVRKIDSIFKKETENNVAYELIEEQQQYEDADEPEESIDEQDADNSDNDEDNNEHHAATFIPSNRYIKNKNIPLEKDTTIIDILRNANKTYSRDDQIQMIDNLFIKYSSTKSSTIAAAVLPELEGDKVTFIGSTFLKYGSAEPYLNHCIVLGTCDDVDGAVIETAPTEKELLLKWSNLIQTENPDIIIGYNIFGFDYEFLFQRSKENDCTRDFLLLSRKIGEMSGKIDPTNPADILIETTKLKIASGEYDMRFFKMTGRLQIDMLAYFRRDFNLPSYKLDDVAGQYIGDDIKKIQVVDTNNPETNEPTTQVTELYSQNLMGLHVGDFIHIEICGFTTDYYKNGKKFRVLNIESGREVADPTGKTPTKKYNIITIAGREDDIDMTKYSLRWGMAKDDVSPQDIFRLSNGSSADRAIVAKYCIQDCNLVHHLMNKIDVVTGYVEMARICSVPISFLIFRGQGIKLTSFVAKKCREKNILMPDLEKSKEMDGYEGAIVLPPKCSMYMDNPVACVDYSSLYPSSMISQNYSHDSKVWTKEYDLQDNLIRITGERDGNGDFIYDNLPEYQYIDIEFDTFKYIRKSKTSREEKTKVGKKICRWAQLPNNNKSVIPTILEELLKARSDTRKMIKTEKDPFMQNILDKRQLGYKVTANSLYSQCGSRTSTFYEKDVAASTTATGRTMITYAKRVIEEVYGDMVYDTECHGEVRTKAEYIYGDTDSVFFTFNLEDPVTKEKIKGKKALEITIEIAQDAAKLCSQWLKSPMELSYEKTLMPFILLSKKRYVGMLYETDPNKGKLKYMGLSIKRRDSCDYLKDIYGGVLNILMKENNIQSAMLFLENALTELSEGRVPIDKLTITKALRSDYKNPLQIGHKVLADRIGKRDPGNKPKSGERIKFVFIETAASSSSKKALMGDKIETPDYILQNKLRIDYTHYITNQLMKPLQQLFGLALEHILKLKGKNKDMVEFQREILRIDKEYGDDLENYMKKREKICSSRIKTILFDDALNKIYNSKNHIQQITMFYHKK